jgi:hypothetical protein
VKILLAAFLTLPLAALAAPRGATPPSDDPPPIECPFCGGNVRMHVLVVSALTSANAEAGRRALTAFWQ